jgi:hypothetical protein
VGCGGYGGLGLGLFGGLAAAVGVSKYFGGSGAGSKGPFFGVWVGVGLTLWAVCFIWHDHRARRAMGAPASLFRSLARWLALALILLFGLGIIVGLTLVVAIWGSSQF